MVLGIYNADRPHRYCSYETCREPSLGVRDFNGMAELWKSCDIYRAADKYAKEKKQHITWIIDRDKNECHHILLVKANQEGRQYAERSGKNDQWNFQADRCK